jgi:hypothetical protein
MKRAAAAAAASRDAGDGGTIIKAASPTTASSRSPKFAVGEGGLGLGAGGFGVGGGGMLSGAGLGVGAGSSGVYSAGGRGGGGGGSSSCFRWLRLGRKPLLFVLGFWAMVGLSLPRVRLLTRNVPGCHQSARVSMRPARAVTPGGVRVVTCTAPAVIIRRLFWLQTNECNNNVSATTT